jgi:response regulator of citrate/malate metabolism
MNRADVLDLCRRSQTAQQLSRNADVSETTARRAMQTQADLGYLHRNIGMGKHGADVYFTTDAGLEALASDMAVRHG